MTLVLQLPNKHLDLAKHVVRKVSSALTRKVTELHAEGFCFDFCLSPENGVYCVQNQLSYHHEALSVELVDHAYDELTSSFRYIHKVETDSGEKGILMLQTIYFNPVASIYTVPPDKLVT